MQLLPARLREAAGGLCHMKAHVFDDSVLLTGANLSGAYFRDRQDRYLLVERAPELAAHVAALVDAVSCFSYRLVPDGTLLAPGASAGLGPSSSWARLREGVRAALEQATAPDRTFHPVLAGAAAAQQPAASPGAVPAREADTWAVPAVQMGSLGLRQDQECTVELLRRVPPSSHVLFSSAYFNLTADLEAALLGVATSSTVDILTASPSVSPRHQKPPRIPLYEACQHAAIPGFEEANGFYGSRGPSGLIPAAYSFLEQRFLCKAMASNIVRNDDEDDLRSGLQMLEYKQPGWTFHAKGLWVSSTKGEAPYVTAIGSPNYGYRSQERDLEAQFTLVTSNPSLQAALREEMDNVRMHSHVVHLEELKQADRSASLPLQVATLALHKWL
eukprot:SM000336S12816  [mRNA]  locus=s336:98261:99673:- [translate_table: standard]